MPSTFNLHVYGVSLEAFAAINEALDWVPARSGRGDLVTQCRRSTSSMISNSAEANGRIGADRLQFMRIAYGSANEAR